MGQSGDSSATHHDERRLLAVIIADIVGYSRLMATNETETYARVREIQRSILKPAVGRYRGEIVKWTGDGLIATFPNAVDAVRASADIQACLGEVESGDSEPLQMRIGVNVGDVILAHADVYGDTVNIAARLQALAEPGGIVVSRGVRDAVKGGYGFVFEDAGAQSVKNIPEPVDTFRVQFDAKGPWRLAPGSVVPARAAAPSRRPLLWAAVGLSIIALPGGLFLASSVWKSPRQNSAAAAPPGKPLAANSASATASSGTQVRTDDAASTDADQDGADSRSQQKQFSTAPGKEVRIGRSWQLDSTSCESRTPPEIVIVRAPTGGHLETRPVEFALRRIGQSCFGHFIKGVDVMYIPKAGFTGADSLLYRVSFGKRSYDREVSIIVK